MAEKIIEKKTPFTELTPVPLLDRKERSLSRRVIPKAISRRHLKETVKRKVVFNSVGDSNFDTDGLSSIGNNGRLLINTTITDVNNELWLMVPEWSLFVSTIALSNEYPNGSFFDNSTPVKRANNYDIVSNIKESSSSDGAIRWSIMFINRTGESVNMGIKLGMRFVVNIDTDPTEETA